MLQHSFVVVNFHFHPPFYYCIFRFRFGVLHFWVTFQCSPHTPNFSSYWFISSKSSILSLISGQFYSENSFHSNMHKLWRNKKKSINQIKTSNHKSCTNSIDSIVHSFHSRFILCFSVVNSQHNVLSFVLGICSHFFHWNFFFFIWRESQQPFVRIESSEYEFLNRIYNENQFEK